MFLDVFALCFVLGCEEERTKKNGSLVGCLLFTYSPEIFRRQSCSKDGHVDSVYILGERDSINFVFVEWSIEIIMVDHKQ